mmetsp:Transcript_8435/g.14461  ORF Transcript_8435/g.14461 Transcript_8435/m.14461 type:complete len:229 (-) Transcript_8435:1476-2162(-)
MAPLLLNTTFMALPCRPTSITHSGSSTVAFSCQPHISVALPHAAVRLFRVTYMASTCFLYFFWSGERFSLNVAVMRSFSTENWCSSRNTAFTSSKLFSLAALPAALSSASTSWLTAGLESNSCSLQSCAPATPAALAASRSSCSRGTTTATSALSMLLPYTQICSVREQPLYEFSTRSTAMYSPWLSLKRFFLRSMTFSAPEGMISPMSPLWKNPSASTHSFVMASCL